MRAEPGSALEAKLFAAMFVVLLLSLGALGVVVERLQRRHFESDRAAQATRTAEVVRRSTSYSMLHNDREALQQIVEAIGDGSGVVAVRISDAQGSVAFSSVRNELARPRPAGSPTSGERTVRVTTPIQNAPSCATAACHAHSPEQKTLGLLDIELSLASSDAALRQTTWRFVALAAAIIILTIGTTRVLVSKLVGVPVRALQAKTAELQFAQHQMIEAEKLTSLGKLAAVVAHEINNPLSGILCDAKLMRKWIDRGDSLDAHATDVKESLELIESESRRCGELVRNLLTFARVAPMNVSDVDLNPLVHQCMKLVKQKLALGGIDAELDLDGTLPTVRGDAGQIEQLLLALIMNAIDAMPHDGELRVVTRNDGTNVVVQIIDNGTGIDPALLPRLFDPFVTTKEVGKGVGLGLAISRSIVERHQGTITVQSEPGKGTTFTIALPTAPALKVAV
jgi:two-component system NtrC family sensor kinase